MALVNPLGKEKKLKPLLLSPAEIAEEKKRAKELTVVQMTSRETADLIMMGIGGFNPLEGFMGKADWKGSVGDMKLTDGTFWPIPVCRERCRRFATRFTPRRNTPAPVSLP